MARRRAKGEGNIRKRSDGRWEGRYTVGRDPETGRLIYKNVLAKTQTECRSKLRAAIDGSRQEQLVSAAMIQHVPEPPQKTYTVEEWLAAWYEFYAKPNLGKPPESSTAISSGTTSSHELERCPWMN